MCERIWNYAAIAAIIIATVSPINGRALTDSGYRNSSFEYDLLKSVGSEGYDNPPISCWRFHTGMIDGICTNLGQFGPGYTYCGCDTASCPGAQRVYSRADT